MSSPTIGHARVGELGRPLRVGGDEHRQRVDEGDARVDRALRVELVRVLGADRQIRDQHVGLRVAQGGDHVNRLLVGLGDDLAVVLAQTVHRGAALHGDAQRWHVADRDGVVLARHDGLGHVPADLLGVDVERGDELDVADVVRAELDMHQARHPTSRVGVLVVLHALDEGTCAVPDAHDGYPYRTHKDCSYLSLLSGPPRPHRPGWHCLC